MTKFNIFLCVLLLVAACTAGPCDTYLPASATGMLWQDNVPGYPEGIANQLLAQLERRQVKLILNNDQFMNIAELKEYEENNKNYTNLCPSTIWKKFPQGVQIDNELYYVLNPKSRPLQFIETEFCNRGTEGQPCNHVDSAQIGYTTECKQEYVTRTVYLMPMKNPSQLIIRSIQIESCCSCFIKQL